ncbi:MAG: ribosome maturation factor RimP [Spirochaetota bacterium]
MSRLAIVFALVVCTSNLSSIKEGLRCFSWFHLSFKEDINTFLEANLKKPLQVFHLEVRDKNSNFLIQVVLDNLENKYGSATVDQCAQVSRDLRDFLDEKYEEYNYTLQVSSAGAERELKLPAELERFKGLLVKLKLANEAENLEVKVVRILEIHDGMLDAELWQKKKRGKPPGTVTIPVKDILRGNLYLDI